MKPATTVRDDNERRIARMGVWIALAKHTPDDDDHAHGRFVFYWIAYEAAYKVEDRNSSEAQLRRAFHHRVTWHDGLGLQETLNEHREPIVGMLKLRQANLTFWYQGEQQATSNGQARRSGCRPGVRRGRSGAADLAAVYDATDGDRRGWSPSAGRRRPSHPDAQGCR